MIIESYTETFIVTGSLTSAFICKSVYFTVYSIQLSELWQPVFSDKIFITLLLHLLIHHPVEFQSNFSVLVNIL